MNNVIQLRPKAAPEYERTIYNDPGLDRIRATKELAREGWPMLLIPIFGWILYALFLMEMRHGRRA